MSPPSPNENWGHARVHRGMRHAALLLHAVSAHDQRQLLEALAPDQRTALRALLDELSALGVAPTAGLDAGLLAPGAAPANLTGAKAAGHASPSWHDPALRDPVRLASQLRDEPDRLIARVLRAVDAPLRLRVVRRLQGKSRRRSSELLAHVASQRPAPRLDALLLAALLQKAAEEVLAVPMTARHRAMTRVSSIWRRLAPRRMAARAETH